MPFVLNVGDPFGYYDPPSLSPFADATGRATVSAALNPAEKTFIAIIEGQSLAANHSPSAYTVRNPTKVHSVNWAGDRLLYQHQEPMFGASYYVAGQIPAHNWNFPYISLWGEMGDLLIERGVFQRVVMLNVAVGGQAVSQAEPGGNLGQRMPMAFHVLRSLGYRGDQVSAIIQMIGESDGSLGTSVAAYKASRRATARVARCFGFTGPYFVPLETYTHAILSPTIRQAQAELVSEGGFVSGPDFDVLGSSYRDPGGTHPNALGRTTMASMWADCIAVRFP